MNLFGTPKYNLIAVTRLLLSKLKIKVTSRSVAQYLEAHPQYPSLLSISDCLSHFKVPNQVYQVEVKESWQITLTVPFITYYSPTEDSTREEESTMPKGPFFLVDELADGDLSLADGVNDKVITTKHEFLATWEGIILVATPDAQSGEANYELRYIESLFQKAALPLLVLVALAGLIVVFNAHPFNWLIFSITLIKFLGLSISLILLAQSINPNLNLVHKICGLVQQSDCAGLLHSKAAKITSWLSWAEIGFFYFAGSFLTVVLLPEFTRVLFWTNLIALPFTVYSISYQYRSKQWCVLCCAIQGLLLLELIFFSTVKGLISFSVSDHLNLVFPFLLCYVFPVLIWGVLKPVLRKASSLKIITQQLNKFRYNTDLFNASLRNQPYYEIKRDLKPIQLGNPEAENVLTIVSNPFCQPCAKAHVMIEEWLKTRKDIKVQIILLCSNTPLQKKVAQHLLSLGLLPNEEETKKAISDWYAQPGRDYESWAAEHPIAIPKKVKVAFGKQYRWSQEAGIAYTPTFLLNGYQVPGLYALEDLQFLIN